MGNIFCKDRGNKKDRQIINEQLYNLEKKNQELLAKEKQLNEKEIMLNEMEKNLNEKKENLLKRIDEFINQTTQDMGEDLQ